MAFLDDSTVSAGGSTAGRTAGNDSNAGGISRRSVLRTGAIAGAWSVPLVQVVAAAPAHATSHAAELAFDSASGSWNGKSANMDTSVTIINSGHSATQALQVTFTFTSGWSGGSVTAPTGWTTTSTSSPYVFTATTQMASGESRTLTPKFRASGTVGVQVKISVSASSSGSASPATEITVPQAG